MGSPKNPESMMGPIISAKQLGGIVRLVDEAKSHGMEIVTGGARMSGTSSLDEIDFSKGYFYPPTIIVGTPKASILDTKIWKEEAFGPVIVVVPFKTEEEAISLANDSEFGLGAAVWTQDLSQAFRVTDQIEAGIVWGMLFYRYICFLFVSLLITVLVNTHHRNDPSSPWGGIGSSGVGSENGKDAYYAYTTTKSTIINYATTEEGIKNDDWFRDGAGDVRYG